MELFETASGLKYHLTKEINPNWGVYDQCVAGMHLDNVGIIIIDSVYCQPIDNEHALGEIYQIIETNKCINYGKQAF